MYKPNLDGTPVEAGLESYGEIRHVPSLPKTREPGDNNTYIAMRPPYGESYPSGRKPYRFDPTKNKYPWGNTEPNEPFFVVDPKTKGGWFKSEWARQPAAVRALGPVAGYYAVQEADEAMMADIDRQIAEETAHMTDDEYADYEREAAEWLLDRAAASNRRKYGDSTKRVE